MLQMNQKTLEAYSAETIQNLVNRIAPILEYRREMYKRYSRKNGLYEIIGDDGQKKTVPFESVSYTHLDVYKRQGQRREDA